MPKFAYQSVFNPPRDEGGSPPPPPAVAWGWEPPLPASGARGRSATSSGVAYLELRALTQPAFPGFGPESYAPEKARKEPTDAGWINVSQSFPPPTWPECQFPGLVRPSRPASGSVYTELRALAQPAFPGFGPEAYAPVRMPWRTTQRGLTEVALLALAQPAFPGFGPESYAPEKARKEPTDPGLTSYPQAFTLPTWGEILSPGLVRPRRPAGGSVYTEMRALTQPAFQGFGPEAYAPDRGTRPRRAADAGTQLFHPGSLTIPPTHPLPHASLVEPMPRHRAAAGESVSPALASAAVVFWGWSIATADARGLHRSPDGWATFPAAIPAGPFMGWSIELPGPAARPQPVDGFLAEILAPAVEAIAWGWTAEDWHRAARPRPALWPADAGWVFVGPVIGHMADSWYCLPGGRVWKASPGKRFWVSPPGGRVWKPAPGLRTWSVNPGARTWRVDPMATFAGTIEKTPGARLWLTFNFGDLPELRAGAKIVSISIPAVAGITITDVALVGGVNGYQVGAWYSGGTNDADYDVTCTITLDDGTIEAKTGTLQVRTKSP